MGGLLLDRVKNYSGLHSGRNLAYFRYSSNTVVGKRDTIRGVQIRAGVVCIFIPRQLGNRRGLEMIYLCDIPLLSWLGRHTAHSCLSTRSHCMVDS